MLSYRQVSVAPVEPTSRSANAAMIAAAAAAEALATARYSRSVGAGVPDARREPAVLARERGPSSQPGEGAAPPSTSPDALAARASAH